MANHKQLSWSKLLVASWTAGSYQLLGPSTPSHQPLPCPPSARAASCQRGRLREHISVGLLRYRQRFRFQRGEGPKPRTRRAMRRACCALNAPCPGQELTKSWYLLGKLEPTQLGKLEPTQLLTMIIHFQFHQKQTPLPFVTCGFFLTVPQLSFNQYCRWTINIDHDSKHNPKKLNVMVSSG